MSLIVPFVVYNYSGSDAGQMLSGIGFLWPVLMIGSSAFQAGASILKVVFCGVVAPFIGTLYEKIINL